MGVFLTFRWAVDSRVEFVSGRLSPDDPHKTFADSDNPNQFDISRGGNVHGKERKTSASAWYILVYITRVLCYR